MPDNLPEVCLGQFTEVAESLKQLASEGLSNEQKLTFVRQLREWLLEIWRESRIGLIWPVPAGDNSWTLFDAATDAMTPVDMILYLLERELPIDTERDLFVKRIGLVLKLLARQRGLPT